MRDLKLIIDTQKEKEWDVDLNIVDGWFEELDHDNQTSEQRAAVASYIIWGSIPGYPDEGVNWWSMQESTNNIVSIDNQVKQNINSVTSEYDSSQNPMASTLTPIYVTDEDTGQIKTYLVKE